MINDIPDVSFNSTLAIAGSILYHYLNYLSTSNTILNDMKITSKLVTGKKEHVYVRNLIHNRDLTITNELHRRDR